ncbi:peptidoglycan-binding domain-containing protein [Aliiruegeria haliotis]|uniref:peptidoglycan-binding domain-containing protein n=1 Tax=Aliiruegeria haliotis TaxID=1280846 RepID=UPI0011B25952|nr:hypothetical protein [Aliiruegeria haliotis]
MKSILLGSVVFSTGSALAGDMETHFNNLTHRQREYVQIRLRAPGFLQSDVDGRFGHQTANAIETASTTPGYQLYRIDARHRGLKDEEKIALYYIMSDMYLHTVVRQ